MYTVTDGSVEDLPNMVKLAREFQSLVDSSTEFNTDHCIATWTLMLNAGIGKIFLLKQDGNLVGALGAVAQPETNTGVLTAVEFFWYTLEAHRGKGLLLFNAYETWAKQTKCKRILMVHLTKSMPEKLKKLYERKGYEKIETTYAKDI